jgi:shikimate kinase
MIARDGDSGFKFAPERRKDLAGMKGKKKNIVLIGMPGAGKSTTGVLVAKALGMTFADTDLLIQEREGRLLQEIIDTEGIEQFLQIEEEAVVHLDRDNCVIATGGSVVYGGESMRRLRRHGVVVYLKLECDEIEKRIGSMTGRGVAIAKGRTLRDVFRERAPLYGQYADVVIDCAGLGVEEVVARIVGSI